MISRRMGDNDRRPLWQFFDFHRIVGLKPSDNMNERTVALDSVSTSRISRVSFVVTQYPNPPPMNGSPR
jgi:hypothetical protein